MGPSAAFADRLRGPCHSQRAVRTVTDPYALVAVQFFDGVTAAVFGVLIPLTVADIAFGSGHFNLAQGVVCTATDFLRRALPTAKLAQPKEREDYANYDH